MTEQTTDEQAVDVLRASQHARHATLRIETRAAGEVTVDRRLFDAYREPPVDVEAFADYLGEVADVLPVAYTVTLPSGERVYVPAVGEDEPGTDPAALAFVLAQAARELELHVERRAREIAEPVIAAARQKADTRVAELEHEVAAWEQRLRDVQVEIARQNRARDREFDELKRLRATVHRVRHEVRCWPNEDGKWFAFRDDLYAALNGEGQAG